jgi:hypothetical protein
MERAETTHRAAQPLPATSEDGVDLTLIRWTLSLSVDERLQLLEDHAAFAWELRHALPDGLPMLMSLHQSTKDPRDGQNIRPNRVRQ